MASRSYHREINATCALCVDPVDRAYVYRTVSGLSRHCTKVHGYTYRANGRYVKIPENELEAARRRRKRRQDQQRRQRDSSSSASSNDGDGFRRSPEAAAVLDDTGRPGVGARCGRVTDRRRAHIPVGLPSAADLGLGSSTTAANLYRPPTPTDNQRTPSSLLDQDEFEFLEPGMLVQVDLPTSPSAQELVGSPASRPSSPPPQPPTQEGSHEPGVEAMPPPLPQQQRPTLSADDIWEAVNSFRLVDVETVGDRLIASFNLPWPEDRFRAIVMGMAYGRYQTAISLRHTAVVAGIGEQSPEAVLAAVYDEIGRMGQ